MNLELTHGSDELGIALRDARLGDALTALQNRVRAAASDGNLRLALFQLLCVLGQWDRAKIQLQTIDSFGETYKVWTRMMAQGLMGEALRRDVFAGETTPLVLGEPNEWIAKLIQAVKIGSATEAAAKLRAEAFEAAPASPAKVNGQEVPWFADADSRLGPVLEGIFEGKYYWIPLDRVSRISIELPTDLRHLVWAPAKITWANGGESPVLIPSRYSGTENSKDDKLRMARLTTWEPLGNEAFAGLGQRLFAAGDVDFPLLEIRTVEFQTAS